MTEITTILGVDGMPSLYLQNVPVTMEDASASLLYISSYIYISFPNDEDLSLMGPTQNFIIKTFQTNVVMQISLNLADLG